ncbi:MAG TPA: PIG-L family deacetylase [Candidatus Sulfopaludibacter sp.]|nr:PIG-L family deacetylase [Candidatus Sulfopaludibacter sp.]
MNPFQKFVYDQAQLLRRGERLPLGRSQKIHRRPGTSEAAPRALIFSPHPDDECIVGGLALRLLRESNWHVINVAVTLGSRQERRPARLRELRGACAALGFDLMVPGGQGLEHITLKSRDQNRAHWKQAVKTIADILREQRPRVIFVPHERDGHPVHVGTHFLVRDALRTLPAGFRAHIVETEFWGQMMEPNLLIELSTATVGDLVAALACHAGEVRRNPYHARLPAWLIDNVRRGAELIGGRGGAAPDFAFAAVYRLGKWSRGRWVPVRRGQRFLSSAMNAGKYWG